MSMYKTFSFCHTWCKMDWL